MFKLTIKTDNAAFEDYPQGEVAWILLRVAEALKSGRNAGPVRDSNGNTVGAFKLTKR